MPGVSTAETISPPTGNAALAQVRSALPALRPSDAKVAHVLLEQAARVLTLTVAEVAAAADVADATVIHCCKELGFTGFQHLKFEISRDSVPASTLLHEQQRLGKSSASGDVIAEVLRTTSEALDDVPSTLDIEQFDKVVQAIVGAQRICVVGAVPSLMLAEDAAYRFTSIGRPAEAPPTDTLQRLVCTQLKPGDLCLVISHTGATKQSFLAIDAARSAGATTAAITSYARSRLATAVDHVLVAGAAGASVRVEAMASRFAHLAVLDALYVAVVLRDEENALRARRVADAIHSDYQL